MKTYTIYDRDFLRMSLAACVSIITASTVLALTVHPYFWPLLIFVPLALSVRKGVEFDFSKCLYRQITTVAGMKRGTWKTLRPDTHQLVMLAKSGSMQSYNPRTDLYRDNMPTKEFFELYVMDETHTRRLFLCSSRDKSVIDNHVTQLTNVSELKVVPFNPVTKR